MSHATKKAKPDPVLVFFDIETTGLGICCDILQIGAVTKENCSFSQYILPAGGMIPADATAVHGIRLQDGQLFNGSQLQEAVEIKDALEKFLTYLQSVGETVIIVGHNINNFDQPVLCYALKTYAPELVPKFNKIIKGVMDTLAISRKTISKYATGNYRLGTLVNKFVPGFQFASHDAMGDSLALKELFMVKFIALYTNGNGKCIRRGKFCK